MRNKSIPSPVENLEYIKCYSLSSPILGRNPGSFIKCNCQNFRSYLRRPKTILEIRRPYLSKWFTRLLFTSFPKTSLTIERKLTGDLTVKICLTFLSPYLRNSLAFSKIRFHNQLILLY